MNSHVVPTAPIVRCNITAGAAVKRTRWSAGSVCGETLGCQLKVDQGDNNRSLKFRALALRHSLWSRANVSYLWVLSIPDKTGNLETDFDEQKNFVEWEIQYSAGFPHRKYPTFLTAIVERLFRALVVSKPLVPLPSRRSQYSYWYFND